MKTKQKYIVTLDGVPCAALLDAEKLRAYLSALTPDKRKNNKHTA